MLVGALRYQVFLASYIPISYLFGTTLLQNTLLTFMPWRTGEISYPLLLRRDYNIPVASSSAVILSIRIVDLGVICIVGLIGGWKLGLQMHWMSIVLILMIAVSGVAILLLGAWHYRSQSFMQKVLLAVAPLRQPYLLIRFLVLSVFIFTLTTLQSMFVLQAMVLPIGILDTALLNAVTLLTSLLPIHPPGGWGTIDSIQVFILEHLHYAPRDSLPAILAAHSFYTLLILIGGVVGWLIRGRNRSIAKAGL
jgi:hypothetical protein